MRWLIVILSVALAVCIYLLVELREKRRERRQSEVRVSAIYKRMYESPWVREMIAAIEARAGEVETALVQPSQVAVPGIYQYSIDTETTRAFDATEVFVVAYIIYACLDSAQYLPPATGKDGAMVIQRCPQPTPEKAEPY